MPVVEINQPERATTDGAVRGPVQQGAEQSLPAVLGFKWLGALFSPRPFLVGVLIGFSLCCYLGHLTTLKNQFGNIPRFGLFVGPQASFYPTITQFMAVVKSRITKEKTLVLVGGSSVLNGVGQSNEQLWTRKLQSELGPQYVVVNLALRSQDSYEGAYFVAEALSKQHEKLIFVTCAHPRMNWHPLGVPPYAYLYWDAKYHNLLCDFPEREAAIAEREKTLPDESWKPEQLTELKLSQFLNSKFNFLELWNTVGYRYFFTSYRSITDNDSFLPRKKLPNNYEAIETFVLPSDEYERKYFPSFLAAQLKWDAQNKQWMKAPQVWQDAENTIRRNVAPQLRPRTLTLLLYMHPDMRHKYETPEELKRDRLCYDLAQEMLRSFGMNSLQVCNDYVGADFRDAVHLAAPGGNKLAVQTAAAVKKMAVGLGYVPEHSQVK